MTKRILLVAALLLLGMSMVEVVGLLQMKASLKSYARHWQTLSSDGDFVYVALGDSAAQGIGASRPERGYVGLLAAHIEQNTGRTVRIVNLSVSGAKIDDVITKQLPQLANYQPDLVTVEIGSNDVVKYDAEKFNRQYSQLAAQVPTGAIMSNVPFFGGRIKRSAEVDSANRSIAQIVAAHHLVQADLYQETYSHRSLFNNSFDLFHPSDRGYRNWERAFWKAINKS